MPTLEQEANKLTNPSLQRSMIKTIKDRGALELFAQLPHKPFEGKTYDFVVEDSVATGNSAQNPYGNTIPEGGGSNIRKNVPVTMLIRNALTAEIDINGKSDYFDARQNDMEKEGKKLARDFFRQFLVGRQKDGYNWNLRGLEHWLNEVWTEANYGDQYVWGTSDGTSGGTAENLSLNMLDDLLSRQIGQKYDALYMSREGAVEFKALLNSQPGNVAAMLMNETFGQPMLHFDGVPIIVNDAVSMDKPISDATVAGTTVTVQDTDFLGFTDLHVGESITLDTGSGNETGTIASVTDAQTAEITTGTDITDGTNGSGKVESKRAVYAVRFDEVDGICAVHYANRGVPGDTSEWYGPIAGFNSEDQGLLENSPQYQTRLDYFGQIVVHDPEAVARLAGFKVT